MSELSHVVDLIVHWQETREQGRELTPEELCRDCPELIVEVKRRLAELQCVSASQSTAPHLPDSSVKFPARDSAPPTEPMLQWSAVGQRVFRPLHFHARGGMGEVFVAEDSELQRKVALKRLQERFVQDPGSCKEFVREAEITGLLEHPGVVPVYGLVQDADGKPCYAMRFIQGESLKEALERFHGSASNFASLEFRQLLTRFIAVCNTIAYAHSRGIIHRDLKPGNIMLGRFGETLVVDWGLARTVERDDGARASGEETALPTLAGDSTKTRQGELKGTLAYMSPEQASGFWDIIGPATDIFSLGATLYHMLVARPPYGDGKTTQQIRQAEFTAPRHLKPGIPAALEAICLKSMARKPDERYRSALELASDLERFLADEPVTAFREPLTGRAGRWLRKHRALAGGVAAVASVTMIALVAGIVMVALYNGKLDAANAELRGLNTSLELAREDAEAKKNEAQRERAVAQAVNDFTGHDLLRQASSWAQAFSGNKPDPDVKVRDLLDRAGAKVGERFRDQPLVEAGIRQALGEAYLGVGNAETAAVHLGRALELRTTHLPPGHRDTLRAMDRLATAYKSAGQFQRAVTLFEQTVAEAKTSLGADDGETLAYTNNLAAAYHLAGKDDLALPLFEILLESGNARNGPDSVELLSVMNNLANTYQAAGKLDLAVRLFEMTLEKTRARLGPDHPGSVTTLNNLARAYEASGKFKQAVSLLEDALDKTRRAIGPDHRSTLMSMDNLARAYLTLDRIDAALPLAEQALEKRKAQFSADHPEVLASMDTVARAYEAGGQRERALPLYRQILEAARVRFGPDHLQTLISMNNLGSAYLAAGKVDEGLSLLKQTLEKKEARLGADHPSTLSSLDSLASAYEAAGKLDQAVPLREQSVAKRTAKLSRDHAYTLIALNNLGRAYEKAGRADAAVPLIAEAVERARKTLGVDHAYTQSFERNLAALHEHLGHPERGEGFRRETADAVKAKAGQESPAYAEDLAALGDNLMLQKKYADAEAAFRESLAIRQKTQPAAWSTFATESVLGAALTGQKKYAEAEPLLLRGHDELLKTKNTPPQRIAEAAERLVRLYDAWNKKEQADEWRKKLGVRK
jgi:hypothetical protein